jgi:enediyne biosynthesis protein E4
MSVRRLTVIWAVALLLSACGTGGDDPVPGDSGGATPGEPLTLDQRVVQSISGHGLTGNPAAGSGISQIVPDAEQAPLEKLGQLLFFSRTLSGDLDVACASCHMPHLGGGDGLSLPVGVGAVDPGVLGPGRVMDPLRDLDPSRDAGPNVPRNSQTIFNVGLYSRALFHDGRAFVFGDDTVAPGGTGQPIRTPESGNIADPNAGGNLLETQARFPLVSNREMRNFRYPEFADPEEYRQFLLKRLRGEAESWKLTAAGPANWLARFCAAFCEPGQEPVASELVVLENLQRAMAAYQASQLFVDTPWRRYLQNDLQAISDQAKAGAILFYTSPDKGGLGCVSCHRGDRLTDEGFHNIGFPQIGRGRRADRSDPARWGVTQAAADRHGFRTPGLLNIAVTAPYGHAGTFATLESLLDYHVNPRVAVDTFFSGNPLAGLAQFQGLDGASLYPWAEPLTREAIADPSFDFAEQWLPRRGLSTSERQALVAFLNALTDNCVNNAACIAQWLPDPAEDPDGNMLIAGDGFSPQPVEDGGYPASIDLVWPTVAARDTFYEVSGACTSANSLATAVNQGTHQFVRRSVGDDAGFGLDVVHGWSNATWFNGGATSYELSMFAGGVTALYPEGSCWPGLVVAAGDQGGVVLYRSRGGQLGFDLDDGALDGLDSTRVTGVASADINGNYRRELMLGNLFAGGLPIYTPDDTLRYRQVASLPMGRSTFGMSFADIDLDGYPDFYLGHWSVGGVPGSAPALWRNGAGGAVQPYDVPGRTSSAYVDQTFNFSPLFADMTGDGRQDLLIVSDFQTTQTLKNRAGETGAYFENVTDRNVITDENGMGGVLGDFFNRGVLEWFVGSIFGPSELALGSIGVTGNRFYRNASTPGQLRFEDVTAHVGGDVADGGWSWGTCAADFNNNGFLDIFQVNGFGHIPEEAVETDSQASLREMLLGLTEVFRNRPPTLYINNGDGTFTEKGHEWGLSVPSEGIGIACFDYDRDGDIDIVLVDQSSQLQFYENQTGHGPGARFLAVRLVGAAPNTDALGARVWLTADLGGDQGVQTQLRVSQANSNFNGQNLPDLHFGVGAATLVSSLTVRWPDGEELVCHQIAVNQFLVIDQRDGEAACPAQP